MDHVTDHQVMALLRAEMVPHLKHKLAIADDAVLVARIVECLKYLSLVSVGHPGPIPVSQEIDDVWHQMILETAEYRRLCRRLPGKGYIHHTSLERNLRKPTPQETLDSILSWTASYVASFGPFSPDRIQYWPVVRFLMHRMQWSLAEVNQLARDVTAPSTKNWGGTSTSVFPAGPGRL